MKAEVSGQKSEVKRPVAFRGDSGKNLREVGNSKVHLNKRS